MTKQIIIGGNKLPNPCVTTACWEDSCITENHFGYSVFSETFNIRCFVFRGCVEHNELKRRVDKKDNSLIQDFIELVIIKNLSPLEIREAIDNIEQRSFTEGYKKAQANIREALGL